MREPPSNKLPDPADMRSVAWTAGQRFREDEAGGDYLAFVPVRPGLLYLHWSMSEGSVRELQREVGEAFNGSSLALRIYDVTLIEFDGGNAHRHFDIAVDGLRGRRYLESSEVDRVWIGELGFRMFDGRFFRLARSQPVLLDRASRSAVSDGGGLYVAGLFERVFEVEDIADAAVYERMHSCWRDSERERVRVVCAAGDPDPALAEELGGYLERLHGRARDFGIEVLAPGAGTGSFDLVHAHNCDALENCLALAGEAPLVLSLHVSEDARAEAAGSSPDPRRLELEARGLQAAARVIVPYGELREQLVAAHGLEAGKVVLLPDLFEAQLPRAFDPGAVKKHHHLHPARPLALFAGEISHAAGADILCEAILHVAGKRDDAQFAIVGEGPLRHELERRINGAGLGGRVRFTGDLHGEAFRDLLAACDFVAIPAHTWQDEGLAHLALENGKPVMATHQSRIHCIHHGENGLMVYDNPGSIIWGLQELFSNPFQSGPGGIMRRPADARPSLDSIAAELSCIYRSLLKPGESR